MLIKVDNVLITSHWGAFVQPLLQWQHNNYYIFWVRACSHRHPACSEHAPYYFVVCGLSNSRNISHCLINGTIFGKNGRMRNVYFDFLYNFCLYKKNWARIWPNMRIGLHVKYSLFLSGCNQTWIFLTLFAKYSNIKFHDNPSGGSRVV
jgi:hypothetical protein